MTIDRKILRQAHFIDVAVDKRREALRDGGLLVIVIVLVFLANFRAIAIGALVDDAIIDVENVVRRLVGHQPFARRPAPLAPSEPTAPKSLDRTGLRK